MATITWAHHSLIARDRKGSFSGSLYTVILAIVFTALQGVEYYQSSFTISDGIFGSVFFFATGYPYKFFNRKINNYYNSSLNILNKRLYTTAFIYETKLTLNPYWITGFADAESSFSIKIYKRSNSKMGCKTWICNRVTF